MLLRILSVCLVAFALVACEKDGGHQFTILSGSENKTLEPIVQEFCRDKGWRCEMRYLGSVDIKLALEQDQVDFDAVWPAHGRWIELGDHARRVKHAQSITTSPVAFGIRDDVAEALNLKGRPVSTLELVQLVEAGKLKFLMTSATQSNSGFSAYIGMLTALAGAPEVLTPEMLDSEPLRQKLTKLLSGVQRSAGSSGWLKDLYLEGAPTDQYTAMVNYEAVLIETNQALADMHKPPLYLVYPSDGTAVADSPLGFVAAGRPDQVEREAFFQSLQSHLLSSPVQAKLLAAGRRTGFGGSLENADPKVFRDDWGIDIKKPLPYIRFPNAETIEDALSLYQEVLRKPSLLAMCLDYSGSMNGPGEESLEAALAQLFDPEIARRFLLQPTVRDIFIALPFDSRVRDVIIAHGPKEAAALPERIAHNSPGGGTDIYACALRAIDVIRQQPDAASHIEAVILMTDGQSQGSPTEFAATIDQLHSDIPVFGITFGDADPRQLDAIAQLTRARVFDGRSDLITAFRHARGYN